MILMSRPKTSYETLYPVSYRLFNADKIKKTAYESLLISEPFACWDIFWYSEWFSINNRVTLYDSHSHGCLMERESQSKWLSAVIMLSTIQVQDRGGALLWIILMRSTFSIHLTGYNNESESLLGASH